MRLLVRRCLRKVGILTVLIPKTFVELFQPRLVIAQKSMKWVQMQRKRYGEKRRGGYVDMGKQVG